MLFGNNNRFKLCKKGSEPIYKVPTSIQEIIPIYQISENGVFQIEKPLKKHANVTFDKVYSFSDINFSDKDEKEKETHFIDYCKFLNSMNINFKIIVANHNVNPKEFNDNVMLKDNAEYKGLVESYNEVLRHQVKEGKNKISQERYLVVTCKHKDFENANAFFQTIEANLLTHFSGMGSHLKALNAIERLESLHRFYRLGKETEFYLTEEDLKKGRDWKNDICFLYLNETEKYLEFEDRFVTTLFAKNYPNSMPDGFFTEITNVPFHTITTMDITPIPKDVVERVLMDAYMNNERKIQKQQEYRNKHQAFSSDITYETRKEKEEIEENLDEIHNNDARMFFVGFTVTITAKDKQDLESKIDTIKTIGAGINFQFETYCGRQAKAMNTALPIGSREVGIMRSLFTQPLAALMPFNVQELFQEGGISYGVNQISKNVLIGDRKQLANGNGFIFGASGYGKSVATKYEMGQVLANTKDDIIVIDPQNEYFKICNNLGGQVINLSSNTQDYINPLEIPTLDDKETIESVIRDKSEFMLGICQKAVFPEELTGKHRSIIDKCISNVYYKSNNHDVSPTFENFRDELLIGYDINKAGEKVLRSDEFKSIAKDLALSLNIFIDGSLNIFSHQSNININNRFVTFGLDDLGDQLRSVSMMIMVENVINRIKINNKRGVATRVYMDEFHVITNNDYGRIAFEKLWKEVRKKGGLLTGITQNVADCLVDKSTKNMLSNSEFILLLNQSEVDRELMESVVVMSTAQRRYITNAKKGSGIMKFGSVLIPLSNDVPRNSKLFDMYKTDFHNKDKQIKQEKKDMKKGA